MVTNACQLRLGSSFEEFISTLMLDPSNTDDVRIYHLMLVPKSFTACTLPQIANADRQHEVEQGRFRLMNNKDALLPHFQHNTAIQPPYHRTQIDFKAFLQESEAIYVAACPETRARYNLVDEKSGPDSSKAVINWLLWQSLRKGEQ